MTGNLCALLVLHMKLPGNKKSIKLFKMTSPPLMPLLHKAVLTTLLNMQILQIKKMRRETLVPLAELQTPMISVTVEYAELL